MKNGQKHQILVESLAGLAFGERIYDVDIVIEKR
jgi:hypothetical protein